MMDCRIADELEGIYMGAVAARLGYQAEFTWERTTKTTKTSGRDVTSEIRNHDPPNTTKEC